MDANELSKYVTDVVLHDIGLLRKMKTSPAMPSTLSEPLVCHLMGWKWVEGNSKHDAEDGDTRIQIKYSKVGFVSLKADDIEHWNLLAWFHAPELLPKVLILIPTKALKNIDLPSGAITFAKLRNYIHPESAEAWQFNLDLNNKLSSRSFKSRQLISIEAALNLISEDIAGSREIIGRGDLSKLEGCFYTGKCDGVDYSGKVHNGLFKIDTEKNFAFRSLSAAAVHITKNSISGNVFWSKVI